MFNIQNENGNTHTQKKKIYLKKKQFRKNVQ